MRSRAETCRWCRAARRLCLAADAAHAGADVDRRLLSVMKQPRIEHQLPIGDGNQVGRDVGAEIAGIGLGDRQRGQRAAAQRRGQLCRTLQKPRMQVEDVTGIGFATRRLTRQQGDLAMRRRVLGQIVDHHQRVLAAIAEILGHGHAGERRDPLQARRSGGRCNDEDAALRRAQPAHASITRATVAETSARPRHRCRSCRWISG